MQNLNQCWCVSRFLSYQDHQSSRQKANCIKKPYSIWQRGIIFGTRAAGLSGVLERECTDAAPAVYPSAAVCADTDVNTAPLSLTETRDVFKVEGVMKQFDGKTSSFVSPSLLFHLCYLQPKPPLAGCWVKMWVAILLDSHGMGWSMPAPVTSAVSWNKL